MKKLLLAALVPLAVQAQTSPSYWETTEYYRSRTLAPINASSAYARGYTGKGSVIAIIDTGIDTTSPEFKNGKIILSKDFTGRNSILDTVGHGTHVAGIAAAANNGVGMEGVAFDASLMIAKVTNTSALSFSTVMTALDWAATNRADVANISASIPLPTSTLKPVLVAPGIYTTSFTNKGVFPGSMDPAQWASAMKNDIIVVVAAGNEGQSYPNAPAQMATATDKNGTLILGGRMIIAGNWNSQNNTMSGNRSGTLCNTFSSGVCQDKYKTSDFFLMAPGTGIYSTVPTGITKAGYINMSGTSMSAPAISGGVAIINQMWPQMTGGNIVKLLMVTANKNLPGYNVTSMGQGLMDLEKATRPVGVVGIPVKGTTAVQPVTTLMASSGSAGMGNLDVMVMDEFQRDFYVKAKRLVAPVTMPEVDIRQTSMPYLSKNNYSQFNSYTDYMSNRVGDIEVGVYFNNQVQQIGATPTMVELALHKKSDIANMKFSVGSFNETGKWLGNSFNSDVPTVSHTVVAGVEVNKNFNDILVYSSLMHGITRTNAQSTMISNIGPVLSYSWTMGIEKKLDQKNSLGFMVYQPVSVYKASATANIPVGLDSEYNVVSTQKISLAAEVQELRSGLYYKMINTKEHSNVVAFFEHRQNYLAQEGLKQNVIGINANYRF